MDAFNFTYVNDCHNITSWTDHIFVNQSLHCAISDMSVGCDIVASDHRPTSFSFAAEVISYNLASNVDSITDCVVTNISDWNAWS
jgi:hypothetical protein